jgi:predicted ATPase
VAKGGGGGGKPLLLRRLRVAGVPAAHLRRFTLQSEDGVQGAQPVHKWKLYLSNVHISATINNTKNIFFLRIQEVEGCIRKIFKVVFPK